MEYTSQGYRRLSESSVSPIAALRCADPSDFMQREFLIRAAARQCVRVILTP